MAKASNVILVHGAWADGSSWSKVLPLLLARGLYATAVQLPLTSLKDDVATVKRALALEDGPTVLVGHSYGGVVITEAGNDPKVLGNALSPREAERKGLVHETVSGKALDRAMEIARRLSSHTPESLAYIKRLVRNATETPLAQGLAIERNLFLKLCISEPALARMRSYEEKKISSPSHSIEV